MYSLITTTGRHPQAGSLRRESAQDSRNGQDIQRGLILKTRCKPTWNPTKLATANISTVFQTPDPMNFGVSRPKLKPWDKPSEVTLNFTDVLGLPSWDVSQDMEIWGQSEGAMVVYIFPLGSWLELLSLPTTFYSYSAEVLRRRRNPLKPTGLPGSQWKPHKKLICKCFNLILHLHTIAICHSTCIISNPGPLASTQTFWIEWKQSKDVQLLAHRLKGTSENGVEPQFFMMNQVNHHFPPISWKAICWSCPCKSSNREVAETRTYHHNVQKKHGSEESLETSSASESDLA